MLLGTKQHTAGNTTRYIIDYSRWLDDGVSLSAVVLTLLTATVSDVTVSAGSLLTEHNKVAFTIAGGSVNEVFTVQVQVTDTRSEIKIDTMSFVVVAP
jgi:hypothetical protein